MNTKEHKTETGVSLDRETVINKLKPLFEKWNLETHLENKSGRFFPESPKWDTDGKYLFDKILNEILNGQDVHEVLYNNRPEHWSGSIEDYEYHCCTEDDVEDEIDEVYVCWMEWEDTQSYQEIHQLLTQIQQNQKVQIKEVA